MKNIVTALSLILAFGFAHLAQAQNYPTTGTVGLEASIQGSQNAISVPIWVTDNITISPMLGFTTRESGPSELRVGLKPRYYTSIGNGAATFVGFQAAVDYVNPEFGDSDSDVLIGLLGGGDYFFNHHFSVGVEGQLNFFMNENRTVSTGAAVRAAYYF